jgi:hypothetical protein
MNPDSNPHEPLVDSALIGLDLTAEHHLAHCPCCQAEREKTEQALRRFAESQRERAAQTESFWQQQAERIRSARRSSDLRSALRAVLVPALAVFLLLAIELKPTKRAVPRPTAQVQTVSDHELLVEVERAVDNGTPYALEPVALLSDEADTTSAVHDKNIPKESRSHAN